jgi:hypothetical protein
VSAIVFLLYKLDPMKYCFFSLMLVLVAGNLFAQSKINNFTRIEIDGPVEIELVAAKTVGVEVLESEDLVAWEVNGESLVVMARYRKGRDAAKLRISVSDLQALEVTGAVALYGNGVFATRNMEITLTAQSVVTLDIDVELLRAKADAQSVLTLSGAADEFRVSADSQSVIDAGQLESANIEATADHQSVIDINESKAKVNKQALHQSVIN